MLSRRKLLAMLPFLVASLGMRRITAHPKPRPGITAARVLTAAQLPDVDSDVIKIFEMVREIPHIADGIYCYCGCAEIPEHYSLLSCYEGDGMAQACVVCQGEGRMVYELHRKGKTLEEIRYAIDRNFG
jgi:hypothetical protein